MAIKIGDAEFQRIALFKQSDKFGACRNIFAVINLQEFAQNFSGLRVDKKQIVGKSFVDDGIKFNVWNFFEAVLNLAARID